MLTRPGGRYAPYFVAAGAGLILLTLVATSPAAARGAHGPISAVTCSATACQLAAGTSARDAKSGMPEEKRQPVRFSGGSGTVHPASSHGLLANCALADLGGSCLMTGRSGPSPSPDAGGRPVTPEIIARRAVSRLRLPAPGLRMSPDVRREQVVRVPTWMWVDGADWRPVSKTVEVPGVAVTATATPVRVVWLMGDGNMVTCAGPGTPYSTRFSASSHSPDCGYVYLRSSAGEPGGVFAVTATVVWNVEWHGGGRGGRIAGLRSYAQAPVRVTEVQGLVVAGAGVI